MLVERYDPGLSGSYNAEKSCRPRYFLEGSFLINTPGECPF